jgi:hypothetical protein
MRVSCTQFFGETDIAEVHGERGPDPGRFLR